MGIKDVDAWRKAQLAVAEWIDSWRVVPRIILLLYGAMLWRIVEWYMKLRPRVIEGCNVDLLKEICIEQAPTTQHAALVTAVIGVSAAVFGLYTNAGKDWARGFISWKNPVDPSTIDRSPPTRAKE